MVELEASRRSILKSTGTALVTAGGVATVSSPAAAARRTISVTETLGLTGDNNDDGRTDGDIDYTIAVTGTDVTAEGDTESDDDISIDYNHDTTHIYGTVNGDTDTYSMPSDERLEFVSATGWLPHAPYDDYPTLIVDLDSGSTFGTYQIEVTGHDNCCYADSMEYEIHASDDISGDGYLENDDYDWGDYCTGTVNRGGLDQWELTGEFRRVEISPKGAEVQVDSK